MFYIVTTIEVIFTALITSTQSYSTGLRYDTIGATHRGIEQIKFRFYHQPQLPINPHCGFPFAASQFGKSYVRKKVMCGPHASLCSSVASHPTLPSAVLHGHLDRQYLYNLGWRRLQKELECARQSTKIEGQPFRVDPLFRQSASSYVQFFPPGYWVFVAVDGLMQLRYMSILRSELSDAVNLSSFHSSIFYCPAYQVPWEDRKPYNKKRHTLRCAFK